MRESRQSFFHALQSMGKDPLDAHVQAKCARFAQTAAKQLASDTTPYRFVREASGVEVYEARASGYRVKAVTIVPGDLEEILFVLAKQGAQPHEFRKTMFHLFQDAFSEGVSLHAPDRVGRDVDHVHLNWLALAHDAQRYDLTYMTSTSRFARRASGLVAAGSSAADLGVQVWQSVEIPELAPFTDRDTGCTRLELAGTGFVVERTGGNLCQVSCYLGFGAAAVDAAWVQTLAARLANIVSVMARPGTFQLVPRAIWTFNAYCYSCFKSFGTFRRRHHCRLCGNSICSKCSVSVEITFPGSPHKFDSTSVPCCHKCADTNHQLDQHLLALSSRASSSLSLSSSHRSTSSSLESAATVEDDSVPLSPVRFSLRDLSSMFGSDAVPSPIVLLEEDPLVDDAPSPTEASFFSLSKGGCLRATAAGTASTSPSSSQRSSRSTLTESDIEASLELLNDDRRPDPTPQSLHAEKLQAAKLRLQLERLQIDPADFPQSFGTTSFDHKKRVVLY